MTWLTRWQLANVVGEGNNFHVLGSAKYDDANASVARPHGEAG